MVINFTPIADTENIFEIPFYINGKNKTPLFIKKVICQGSKPKFLIKASQNMTCFLFFSYLCDRNKI